MSKVKTQRSNKVKGKWQNFNQRRPSSSQSAGNSTHRICQTISITTNREERIVKKSGGWEEEYAVSRSHRNCLAIAFAHVSLFACSIITCHAA